jgi:hypothetical protein
MQKLNKLSSTLTIFKNPSCLRLGNERDAVSALGHALRCAGSDHIA